MSFSTLRNITVLLAVLAFGQSCSAHRTKILVGGLVGASVGAGLGYGVVHHGKDRRYEIQNTIITSSIFAVGFMGALALHYYLLDQQKVDIMSGLTSKWMEDPDNQNKVMKLGSIETKDELFIRQEQLRKHSLSLDNETRWIYPTFRRRYLEPEASQEQITSARYTWEVVRPGFFVSRETHPWYFQDEALIRWNEEDSQSESLRDSQKSTSPSLEVTP